METGQYHHCVPRFRLLDDRQIQRIHHAALRILDEVGVRIYHQ
jgi:trimethylamine:corrinoid methyltransferase-like protein